MKPAPKLSKRETWVLLGVSAPEATYGSSYEGMMLSHFGPDWQTAPRLSIEREKVPQVLLKLARLSLIERLPHATSPHPSGYCRTQAGEVLYWELILGRS